MEAIPKGAGSLGKADEYGGVPFRKARHRGSTSAQARGTLVSEEPL